MATIIQGSRRIRLYAAAIALAALAITVLAVAYATGPAQAQGGGSDFGANNGHYQPPYPCGEGMAEVSKTPDGEFSEGHVALFDGYWDYESQTLNNNLCPPLADHTVLPPDRQGIRKIVTGRTESNIDVNTTVFHAGDEFQHTITAEEADKYEFLPPAGTQVWWLKQDDPLAEALAGDDEDEPELVLGLSAGLFKKKDWYAEECNLEGECTELPPLQYEFEAERDTRGNVIPFVVFENDAEKAIWDSREADINSIELWPGEYKHYNWVFFPPDESHTYVLEVHMKGHVRMFPAKDITPDNWKPLTWPKNTHYDPTNTAVMDEINKTVTSELRKQKYTIHVGPLHLNEQPQFGAYGMVHEGAAPGTLVVHHIPVYGVDRDELHYDLHGDGEEDFEVVEQELASWISAKIVVKEGASLIYPERPYYDLRLTVSDGHNRTEDPDDTIDDSIPVRIQVFPNDRPYAYLQFPNQHPRTGESMEIKGVARGLPAHSEVTSFTLQELTAIRQDDGTYVDNWETVGHQATSNDYARFHFSREKPGPRKYKVEVSYLPSEGVTETVESALYPITWRR